MGDWVHRGIADLGFAALAPDNLATEHIRDEPLFVVARRGHRTLGADVVTDMGSWQDVGRAHGAVFGNTRPATTIVQVGPLISPDLLVEISAVASLSAR